MEDTLKSVIDKIYNAYRKILLDRATNLEYAGNIQISLYGKAANIMLKELPKKVPEMKILDLELLTYVKDMAGGMTKEEILETFSIELKDLAKDEGVFFDEFYNYGKGMAVHKVINNLIESTKGRQGQGAAMHFLRRFAKNFEGDLEGDSSGTFSFQFGTRE